MPATDDFRPLIDLLDRFGDLDVRLGGGWGIDVLAGRVTRAHHDVDLFVPVEEFGQMAQRLAGLDFELVLDESLCRQVWQAADGRRVDLNAIVYRADGHGTQTDTSGDMELFPAWGWTRRRIAGHSVMCLSAEAQRIKHRGYPERPQDRGDLATIAHVNEAAFFDPAVRPIEPGEEDLIEGIEAASDRLLEPFDAFPLPPSTPEHKAAEMARTMVTLVAGRPPVGFVRLEEVDGHTHLGQLSVLPEYGRLGIGTALVEAACSWARHRGDRVVTLTTFTDVPFNAPFYRRLGFQDLPAIEIGRELAVVVADEVDLVRYGARSAMARPLGPLTAPEGPPS